VLYFLGFLGQILTSFLESRAYKLINIQEDRNALSFWSVIIWSLVSLLLISLFFSTEQTWSFLKNPYFYVLCLTEPLTSLLYREAYYHNKKSYTVVNMFNFSTLYLMAPFAYVLNQITGFENNINGFGTFNETLII